MCDSTLFKCIPIGRCIFCGEGRIFLMFSKERLQIMWFIHGDIVFVDDCDSHCCLSWGGILFVKKKRKNKKNWYLNFSGGSEKTIPLPNTHAYQPIWRWNGNQPVGTNWKKNVSMAATENFPLFSINPRDQLIFWWCNSHENGLWLVRRRHPTSWLLS